MTIFFASTSVVFFISLGYKTLFIIRKRIYYLKLKNLQLSLSCLFHAKPVAEIIILQHLISLFTQKAQKIVCKYVEFGILKTANPYVFKKYIYTKLLHFSFCLC